MPLPPADYQEMFQAYVGMGDVRSYQKVADQYGVAKHTIVRIAMRHEWLARLAYIEAEAKKEADKRLAESRAEVHERHLRMIKVIATKGLQGLQAHSFDSARDAAKAVEAAIKLERTAMGESNDHRVVSVQELTRREVDAYVTPSLFDDLEDDEGAEGESVDGHEG